MLHFVLLLTIASWSLGAAQLRLVETTAAVYDNGVSVGLFGSSSPEFTSSLDSDNYGDFTFTIANSTGAAWTNTVLIAFLDADIDALVNGYSNEFGDLVSLALPPGAPVSATPASAWEVDEPGYVFGDIYVHLVAGFLDNTTAVTPGSRNDVSLALLFSPGDVPAGSKLRGIFSIGRTPGDGLSQTDPDSPASLYFNGYAEVLGDIPPVVIPEPGSFPVMAALILLVLFRR